MLLRLQHNREAQRPRVVEGRALVLATVVVLALLNPLLCSLHCFFSIQHASTIQLSSGASFFCEIPDGHASTNESTTAPSSTVTPRAVYDLTSLATILLASATFLIAFFMPMKQCFTTLFIAPLLPPPRTAG